MPFFYEKWDVFKAALRMREIAQELSRLSTVGIASDLENLRRAASSCVTNLAEGARERHLGKKLDRYGTTRSSASECNGAFIVLEVFMPPAAQPLITEGREIADRVSAMTTNLIRANERRPSEPKNKHRQPPPPPTDR